MMLTKFQIPEVNLNNISKPDVYDTFAKNYNKPNDKLNAVANFIKIREGYEKQLSNIKGELNRDYIGVVQDLDEIIPKYKKGEYSLSLSKEKELKKNKKEPINFVSELVKDVKIAIDNYLDDFKSGMNQHYKDRFQDQRKSLEDKISSLQDTIQGFKFHALFDQIFKDAVYWSDLHFRATFHMNILDSLIQDILFDSYPKTLKLYKELPEERQREISGPGRPPKKDLPQSDIESFVEGKLYPDGELTNSKTFVHRKGPFEGLPNWNQLALSYLAENPKKEDVFSERQLKERIKRAYEVIISSMN